MKRTITEIFIEVEEIVAVRQTGKLVENQPRPSNEQSICPHCGQAIPENKNLSAEMNENDEQIRLSE